MKLQSLWYLGISGFLWKTSVCGGLEGPISSAWPGGNQRETVCATGAGWWGKLKDVEVYFHTSVWGKEGSKDSGLFCLMWYLLDASLFFLESVLCSVFFPLNFLFFFFFYYFGKTTAYLVCIMVSCLIPCCMLCLNLKVTA